MSRAGRTRGPGCRAVPALACLCLLAAGCDWSLRQSVLHPSVERRVKESLAMPGPRPPDVDPAGFRFAIFGDPQVHADGVHRVGRLREEVRARGIDFVCVLGDLTHDGTADQLMLMRAALDSLGVPWYAVPGNHDLYQPDGWERFKELCGPGVKSFDAGGRVRIILFDTASGVIGPTQFRWLEAELARPGIKVLGTHYPLYDGGAPVLYRLASEAERYRLSSLLRDRGAWGLVSGHIHGFRALAAAGVRYITCGAMAPDPLDYGVPGFVLGTFAGDSLGWEFVPVD
jgi:predicted phosphodiesterase